MSASPSTAPRQDLSLDLPDGRRLAYAEWGDPAGRPILFLHRSPGSRLFDPGPGATAAVRLITVDRPGYGGTVPVPDPSFAAAAADVSALTRLWYGAGDEYIKLEHGVWYGERIAGSRLEQVEGAGHPLPVLHWREILAAA